MTGVVSGVAFVPGADADVNVPAVVNGLVAGGVTVLQSKQDWLRQPMLI